MKALFTIILLAALALLWFDDKAKRGDLAEAQSRADNAEQQVQLLTARVNQLQVQLAGVARAAAGGAGAPSSTANANPSWFQQRLNGLPTVLDPASTEKGH